MTTPTPTDADVERVARAWREERKRYVICGNLQGNSGLRVYFDKPSDTEGRPLFSGALDECERFLDTLCARAAIAAMPAPAVPAGWRLVPVEPTEAMERAGAAEVDRANPYSDDVANNIWHAMLRTRPAPPAPASEDK
jgi:hypothetical protein